MIASTGVPEVSIIVPTFNRRSWLERLLRALDKQGSEVCFEVVVCVDGASDGTEEMLRLLDVHYALRVLPQSNSGPAAARNRALAGAAGDIVIFMDDDVVPASGFVDEHVRAHRDDTRLVALGPILTPPGARLNAWARYEADLLDRHYAALQAGRALPEPRFFFTGNASVRREHALAVGGFDEGFKRGEDVEFGYRLAELGLRFGYVSNALVYHESDHPFSKWARIPYEYGRQDVIMAVSHSRTSALENAYRSWPDRHFLTRLLAQCTVGQPWRQRVLGSILGWAITADRLIPLVVQSAMCSILFNVRYWEGVADATGLGPNVWSNSVGMASLQ